MHGYAFFFFHSTRDVSAEPLGSCVRISFRPQLDRSEENPLYWLRRLNVCSLMSSSKPNHSVEQTRESQAVFVKCRGRAAHAGR